MNTKIVTDDNDMPAEINFPVARRNQFSTADAQLKLPVYLEQQVQTTLAALASAKGVDLSALINDLLKKMLNSSRWRGSCAAVASHPDLSFFNCDFDRPSWLRQRSQTRVKTRSHTPWPSLMPRFSNLVNGR